MSWTIAAGLLYGLAFPPFNFRFLAWFSLVPLLMAVSDGHRPFVKGLISGFIANLLIFSWLWPTFHAAHIGLITTFSCWILLALILSLYFASFGWVMLRLPRGVLFPWAVGALWVALEHIRSLILTGFPWALLGHTQAYNLPVIQVAAITGVDGVSFLVAAVNAGIFQAIRWWSEGKDNRGLLISFATVVAVVIGVIVWGTIRPGIPETFTRPLKVAILQGNIDQYQKWDRTYEEMIRSRYEKILARVESSQPDVVVWPESAVPGELPNDDFYLNWVSRLVQKSSTTHLVGSVSSRGKGYNSLFQFTPDGKIAAVYDKQKLVPFGEYIPFGGFMGRWIPYLGQLGTFSGGQGFVVMDVRGIKMSGNICYEAMFSGLIRDSVRNDAQVIVNVTNDGWFLNSGAPEQHFVTNIFRAVENGRPVVRAANTGISAVIDARGRILARTELLKEESLVQDVQVSDTALSTLYHRYGNWFSFFCWVFLFSLLIYSRYNVTRTSPSY